MEEFLSDPTAILTCQAVERSNHLKKKARIVEGSRTRVEPSEAELSLKSAELVLCIVGLYHLLKPSWRVNSRLGQKIYNYNYIIKLV